MLQDSWQSTEIIIPKPHAHVITTQMNVREGIKKFDDEGNETLLKELNQLAHEERRNVIWGKKDHYIISCSQQKNMMEA